MPYIIVTLYLILSNYLNFQVDAESNKELEQWNEMLKNDAVKLCQENNFNTGFFEGSDNYCVIDAYELKVSVFDFDPTQLKYLKVNVLTQRISIHPCEKFSGET